MQSAEQTVVDGFMRELDEIEKRVPMLGSYARTDPKIVEYEQAGILFRMVTFHVEFLGLVCARGQRMEHGPHAVGRLRQA